MKRVLINVEDRELRVAILEDEQLLELYIESLEDKSILNNIYKGRIEGILPGLKAAFVNIGLERNAFLHFDDVRPDMLWARYRQDHPESVLPAIAAPAEDDTEAATEAEVAHAEEFAAATQEQAEADRAEEVEAQDDAAAGDDEGEGGARRRRRRGRRGGKGRKRDADQPFDPVRDEVLDADIDTDDDEDDEEEAQEQQDRYRPQTQPRLAGQGSDEFRVSHESEADDEDEGEGDVEGDEGDATAVAAGPEGPEGTAVSRQEQQRNARTERQHRRRERWEQKKLERKMRRQEGGAPNALPPQAPVAQPQQQPRQQPVRAIQPHPTTTAAANAWVPPAMRGAPGTRGAANPYDVFSPYNQPAPAKRQWGKRGGGGGGDDWGNQRMGVRRNDTRDSQEDFFGPAPRVPQPHFSDDDDAQPFRAEGGPQDYYEEEYDGPAPGNEKFPTSQPGQNRNQQNNRRPNNNNNNNKRRSGGRNRSMKKRNPSYYAARARKGADQPDAEPAVDNPIVQEKPKARRKKVPADAAPTVTENATVETAPPVPKAATRGRKKAEPQQVAPVSAAESAPAEAPAPKKRTRKKTDEPAETAGQVAASAAPDAPPAPAPAETEARPARGRKKAAPKPTAPAEEAPAAPEPRTPPAPAAESAPSQPAPEAAATPEAAAPADPQTGPSAKRPSRRRGRQTAQPETAAPEQAQERTDAPAAAKGSSSQATDAPWSEAATAAAPAEQSAEAVPTGPREERERSRRRGRRGRGRDRDRGDRAERPDDSQPSSETAPAADTGEAPAIAEAQPPAEVQTPRPPREERGRGRGRDRDRNKDRGGRDRERTTEVEKPRRWQRPPQFTETFKKGDEILVQVIKEEIGMKGARISTFVSMPGRYLVLLPYPNEEGGISRKVEDITERKRLKRLLKEISSDEMAFIIRTAGVYRDEADIRGDVEFLTQEWKTIAERAKTTDVGKVVYDDHDILYRLARDVFDDNVSEILIDSHLEGDKLKGIMSKLIPSLVDKVKVYSGAENIFHKYGVEKQIQKAARRKVWLKSGGYLIIDEAEALTAIDVNTGKSVGKDDQEKLILKTNLEAARAVARELKLRDIGGLIVIDFIDMKDSRNRDQVVTELKTVLRKDRSKTSVSTISEFGLVEMTRKRVRRSLRKTLFMDCPYCQGAGVVLNEQQIWLHLKHEIIRHLEGARPAPNLNVTVNSKIRGYVDQNYRETIRKLEQKYDSEIRFTMSDVFHMENYAIEKVGGNSAPTAMSAASGGR